MMQCTDHNRECDSFCETCSDAPLCERCYSTSGEHYDHIHLPLSAFARKERIRLQQQHSKTEQKIIVLNERLEKIGEVIDAQNKSIQNVEEIDHLFERAKQKKLRKYQQEIDKKMKILTEKDDTMVRRRSHFKRFSEKLSKVLRVEDNSAFVKTAHNSNLQMIDLEIPNIPSLLEETISKEDIKKELMNHLATSININLTFHAQPTPTSPVAENSVYREGYMKRAQENVPSASGADPPLTDEARVTIHLKLSFQIKVAPVTCIRPHGKMCLLKYKGENKIKLVDSTGKQHKLKSFESPIHLYITTEDRDILVIHPNECRIHKLTVFGVGPFIYTSGLEAFDIAIDNVGHILVTCFDEYTFKPKESAVRAVVRYDQNGLEINRLMKDEKGTHIFTAPRKLAISTDGYIAVINFTKKTVSHIVLLSKDLVFQRRILDNECVLQTHGRRGIPTLNTINHCKDVVFTKHRYMLVAVNDELAVVDILGNVLQTVDLPNPPLSLAIDADKTLWVGHVNGAVSLYSM